MLFSGANRSYKMNRGIEFIPRICFLFFIVGLNADPIDESRKWGNATATLLNRYDSIIKLGKNKQLLETPVSNLLRISFSCFISNFLSDENLPELTFQMPSSSILMRQQMIWWDLSMEMFFLHKIS